MHTASVCDAVCGRNRSIHEATACLGAKAPQLHILIANAGVFCPPHAKTEQGFEVRSAAPQWAVRQPGVPAQSIVLHPSCLVTCVPR